jgi:hypothetical protein
MVERDRGILTKRDREYILGEKDVEPGSSHDRVIKSAIRNRVKESLLDFGLLLEYLDETEYEKIFQPPQVSTISKAIAVFFLAAQQSDYHSDFWWIVGDGVRWGADQRGQFARFDIDRDRGPDGSERIELSVELNEPDIDELIEKIENNTADMEEYVWVLKQEDVSVSVSVPGGVAVVEGVE